MPAPPALFKTTPRRLFRTAPLVQRLADGNGFGLYKARKAPASLLPATGEGMPAIVYYRSSSTARPVRVEMHPVALPSCRACHFSVPIPTMGTRRLFKVPTSTTSAGPCGFLPSEPETSSLGWAPGNSSPATAYAPFAGEAEPGPRRRARIA